MSQNLNLYKHLDHAHTLRFSALQGLYACSALFGFLSLVALWLAISSGMQARQLASAKQERTSLQQELAGLQASSAQQADKTSLQEMRELIANKRALLASVGESGSNMFSDYLAGLGRQHINGLWLDHVLVEERGERIAIKGAMRSAALLPRYLQKLGNEPVFKGLRFQLMKIEEQPEVEQQMRFEIAVVSDSDILTGSES